MHVVVRPVTAADLPAVLGLLVTTEMSELGYADCTAETLQEEWAEPGLDLSSDTFVAWVADLPVSYGMVRRTPSSRIHADHYVRPGEQHWPAGRVVLDHMAARAAEIATEKGHPEVPVTLGQAVAAPFPTSELPKKGWQTIRRFNRMTRALSDVDAGDVVLPAGVSVRVASTEADRRAHHRIATESFADHWRTEPESYEALMQRLTAAERDWSLWWLATVDGEDVGALKSRLWAPGVGFVDRVGVVIPARGRGIGSALLGIAFAEFARRGCTRVELGVDTENVSGALRLYEAAGMTPAFQVEVWELLVPAA